MSQCPWHGLSVWLLDPRDKPENDTGAGMGAVHVAGVAQLQHNSSDSGPQGRLRCDMTIERL
jgi:hypothetical protein